MNNSNNMNNDINMNNDNNINMNNDNKLNGHDLMNIGIFGAIYFVILFFCSNAWNDTYFSTTSLGICSNCRWYSFYAFFNKG